MRLLTLGKKEELVLPRAVQKTKYNASYGNYSLNPRYAQGQHHHANPYSRNFAPTKKPLPTRKKAKLKRTKVKKRFNPLLFLLRFGFALLLGGIILPQSYLQITKTNLINPIKYRNIKINYTETLRPTLKYLNNAYLFDTPLRTTAETKKTQMQTLFEGERMTLLETRLQQLKEKYKLIHPSIYVWEYEQGKYANINADELFPTASIIKIPVLIEMFREIEEGHFKLYDKMVMGEHYRTSGSGSLQYRAENSTFSMDSLARHMIEESDNTSTNMIMAKIGGKHSVNRALKNWGMEKTHIENWLPDLSGENVSTAREMSTILYNINNESLLNINSRENIIDYMSHVKNNRLIAAGLPNNAQFIHKTGDIGKMLGDAGIVYAPNGQRYIITIFAKRPYNHHQGKEFITEASEIIYNYIVNNKI